MNKTELIAVLAEKSGVTKKVAGDMLDAFCTTVVDTVAGGEPIQLVGFGTFTSVKKSGREGVNPITKAPVHIAPSVCPKFKPGKGFKDACNK